MEIRPTHMPSAAPARTKLRGSFQGKPFCSTTTFLATLLAEERDGMLVIDLKQPGTKVSGHSSRAHSGGD